MFHVQRDGSLGEVMISQSSCILVNVYMTLLTLVEDTRVDEMSETEEGLQDLLRVEILEQDEKQLARETLERRTTI